jgi:predicted transcriptional regulator
MDVNFQLNLSSETVDRCDLVKPLCLAPIDTVAEALRQMKDHNCGAVLVCDQQHVNGIFTVPLQQFMTPDPVVLRARDSVGKAITFMAQGGYRRLPIVDDLGRPTGIITVQGIMHYLVEHFPTVIYNLPPAPHHSFQQREGA